MARLPKSIATHEIVTMPVDALKPADYNPRKITAKQKEGLRASLRRFGNVQLIVWNKRTGTVVGGHQRLTLLLEAGVKETQVVVVDLGIRDEKALNVALNSQKIAGDYDEKLLQPILRDLASDDDLFKDLNLDELLIEDPTDDGDLEKDAGDGPQKVVSYQIVFDDEAQQSAFYKMLALLKRRYPLDETVGARLATLAETVLAEA